MATVTSFDRATATLYQIASIYDVGNQLLRQSGSIRWDGLPRTFDEYVERLYGSRPADRFMLWNYGLLAAVVALCAVVAAVWR